MINRAEKTQSDSLDDAYYDRNQAAMLSARLAKMADLEVGWYIDPNEPDWPVLFIELPTGQVSWHIPMDEALDHHRNELTQHNKGWDGHTLEEKRHRLLSFLYQAQ